MDTTYVYSPTEKMKQGRDVSLDVYLEGLIHFVGREEGDAPPDVFMEKVRERFSQSMDIDLSSYVGSSGGAGAPAESSLLALVERIEASVSTGEICLVECTIPSTLDSDQLSVMFSMIDVVQRIVRQYKVPDNKLKLFFVNLG